MKTKCPIAGCDVMKRRTMLMCKSHWRLVPDWLQREVWTYYKNKNWPEWLKASKRATAEVNAVVNSRGGNRTRTEPSGNLKFEI
jgi:hypothetical protein